MTCAASRLVLKIVSSKLRPADEAAGVDVDRRHGLGLVDDEVPAGLQVDAARQRLLDLVLDAVQVEQRPLARVMRDALDERRRVLARELEHLGEGLARVDHDAGRLLGRHVAQHALREIQVLVEERRRGDVPGARVEIVPQLREVLDVALHLALGGGLRHRADDEAAAVSVRQQQLELAAQAFALGFVLDPLRNADVRILRQVDEQPAREAHLRGQPRALGADRVLDHLHEQRLTLVQDLLDGTRVATAMAVLPVLPDVGDVEERRALEADLDERALHPGEHPRDAPEADVADEAPRAGALDVELLHDALLEHRDARFLGGYVDEDFMRHRVVRVIARGTRCRRAPLPSRRAAAP